VPSPGIWQAAAVTAIGERPTTRWLPGDLGRQPKVLLLFVGAHVINDFTATSLPVFLPAIEEEFGLTYLQLGLLSLTFTILSGAVQPLAGNFADRNGKRRATLVFGFVSTGLGFILIGLSPMFWLVVASSLFCGLGGSTYHPQATAFLVRSYPAERGRTLGLHGWGGSIGHFLAPVLVALAIAAFGWRLGVALFAIPSVLAALIIRSNLAESPPNPGASLRGAASRNLLLMAVTFGLLGMVLRGFLGFLPTYLVELDWTLTEAGVITTLILVVGMFAQPLGGAIFDRVGGRQVFVVCSIGAAVGVAGFGLTTSWLALVFVTIMAFFVFALFPVSLAMASELAGAERTGAAAGIVFGITGLVTAVVPALIGGFADQTSLHTALSSLVVFPILAAALSLFLPNKLEVQSSSVMR
jgi:FSR family fosmidomycin resistance protein-like MFS transporter